MGNELAKTETNNAMVEWQVMKDQASMLVKTGFLPTSIKTPEQAVAIMMSGRELGVPPMQALRGINVIQGTPAIKPELMLALCVQRIPGFEYSFENCSNTSATFTAKRPSMSKAHSETFTMDDAKRAGLADKDNWRKWPGNMLRWRAVGNCLHVVAPDVLVGVYTPDELGAVTNEAGEIIEMPAAEVVQGSTKEQWANLKAAASAANKTPEEVKQAVLSAYPAFDSKRSLEVPAQIVEDITEVFCREAVAEADDALTLDAEARD